MSRKLVIGFDGVPHGSVSVRDGKFVFAGANPDAVRHHAQCAADTLLYSHPAPTFLKPEHVLDHLAKTLQGRTHAHWEEDGEESEPHAPVNRMLPSTNGHHRTKKPL